MSISPISASSLYQEQINYFLKARREDGDTVKNLLAKFGVVSSGDEAKDLAKLQELQLKSSAQKLQDVGGSTSAGFVAVQTEEKPWFSIMYQLGLDPTGDAAQDYKDIMTVLVNLVQNAGNESEFNKYMGIISLVEDLFISSGVKISDIQADSVSSFMGMELLAQYNKAKIQQEPNT